MADKDTSADLETMSIEEAGKILKVSRNTAYEFAKTGAIPVVKFGPRLMRVPVQKFRRMLNGE